MENLKKISGIYRLIDRTGREYIGSSVNLYRRETVHFSQLRRNKHHNKRLQNYYNKYGQESLSFEVIEFCSAESLTRVEQEYIDNRAPYFNISKSADRPDCWKGRKHTEETKRKLSEITKAKPAYRHTPESRLKIGQGNKGKTRSEEAKMKVSIANKGKRKGVIFTEEHKAKISAGRKGMVFTEEHRRKISESRKLMFLKLKAA